MTRQVALSEEAYAALRKEKQPSESFSQTVLRLLAETRHAKKDPLAFARRPHRFTMTMEEHLALVEAMRDADLVEER